MRALAAGLALVVWLAATPAQAQEVRLAAPSDCLANPGCAQGMRSVYGLDVRPALVRLRVADAGIRALDDGLAEIAVAFSSNPEVSRPDITVLRDDRRMIYRDHVTPVVRRGLLRAHGPRAARDIRRRLNAVSAALSTLALRGLNQAVIDGRLPEAVGGEFIDANGLGGAERTRRGPRIVVGYMRFAENETLAHLYAEALRAGGYRVVVRDAGGLRREVVRALRRDRIDIYPDYSGTLLRFLNRSRTGRRSDGLRRALARIDAVPMRRARAQNRNVFVTKRATATALAITKLSDLHGYWPGVDTQDAVAAQR